MRADTCMSVTFHPARAHSSPDTNRIPQKSTEANTWRNCTCHMAEFSFLDDLSTWISFHLLHWKNTSEVASREASWVVRIQSKCTSDRKSARHVSREQNTTIPCAITVLWNLQERSVTVSIYRFHSIHSGNQQTKNKGEMRKLLKAWIQLPTAIWTGRKIKEHLHVPF